MDAINKLIEAVEAGTIGYEAFCDEFHDLCLCVHCESAYHGSLDAAKALHDALLPGWLLDHMGEAPCTASGWHVRVAKIENLDNSETAFDQPNPARAWLLAILRASAAQSEGYA